jgi:hypothetical protein
MTAPAFPSLNKIQHHIALAIGKLTFTWPPTRFLPMLPNKETEKLVSCFFLRQVLCKVSIFGLLLVFSGTSDDC